MSEDLFGAVIEAGEEGAEVGKVRRRYGDASMRRDVG